MSRWMLTYVVQFSSFRVRREISQQYTIVIRKWFTFKIKTYNINYKLVKSENVTFSANAIL